MISTHKLLLLSMVFACCSCNILFSAAYSPEEEKPYVPDCLEHKIIEYSFTPDRNPNPLAQWLIDLQKNYSKTIDLPSPAENTYPDLFISPDNSMVAVAYQAKNGNPIHNLDNKIAVFSIDRRTLLHDFNCGFGNSFSFPFIFREPIEGLAISPDCSKLVAGSCKKVKFWNLHGANPTFNTLLKKTRFASPLFNHDGSRLICIGGADLYIFDMTKTDPLHNWAQKRIIAKIPCSFRGNTKLALSTDELRLAAIDSLGTISIFDLRNNRLIKTLKQNNGVECIASAYSIILNNDGSKLLSWGGDFDNPKTTILWDLNNGAQIRTFSFLETKHSYAPSPIVNHDWSRLVVASGTKTIQIINLTDGKLIKELQDSEYGNIEQMKISPDDSTLFTVIDDNGIVDPENIGGQEIKRWDMESGSLLAHRNLPHGFSLKLSQDSSIAAFMHWNGKKAFVFHTSQNVPSLLNQLSLKQIRLLTWIKELADKGSKADFTQYRNEAEDTQTPTIANYIHEYNNLPLEIKQLINRYIHVNKEQLHKDRIVSISRYRDNTGKALTHPVVRMIEEQLK